jgi:hypothetical protein
MRAPAFGPANILTKRLDTNADFLKELNTFFKRTSSSRKFENHKTFFGGCDICSEDVEQEVMLSGKLAYDGSRKEVARKPQNNPPCAKILI